MSQSRECLLVTGYGKDREEALADADKIALTYYGPKQDFRSDVGFAQVEEATRELGGSSAAVRFSVEVRYTPVAPF